MDKLLEAFFMCWNEHRSDELSTIFAPCASYEIVNKRKIFKGLDQIEAYWRRNSKRQRNLKMFWSLLEAKRFNGVALFYATFYDIEEKDYNQFLDM
jgi:hypothetical protein